MKRLFIFMLILSLKLFSSLPSYSLDVRGAFTTETRFSISNGDLLFNQENGNLQFEQQVNDNLYGMASMNFRYYNNPIGQTGYSNILNASELGLLYSIQPVEIDLDQAYFTYRNFIFDNLDITAGKQRMAWGTADILNPTDLLNAYDYSDPIDYGKKIPSVAININYALPAINGNFQFVYEPYSPISRLNNIILNQNQNYMVSNIVPGMASGMPGLNQNMISTSQISWNGTAVTPPANISNFEIGMKLSGTVSGIDLSVSYINRINDMPYVNNINITGDIAGIYTMSGFMPTNAAIDTVTYNLAYYRENVIGFDFSKDLDFILLWGEAAVIIPEQQQNTSVSSTYNIITPYGNFPTNIIATQTALSNQPYVKYTIGFDKTFGEGWYINLQYNHGFFDEAGNTGPGRLEDYFLLRLEKKFLNERLKLSLTGMYNINNLQDAFTANNFVNYVTNNSGVMGQLAINYAPSDDTDVELGIMEFGGNSDTSLGIMNYYSMVYMKFSYNF